ncbi:MAG: ABC transporter substrate-binding protein, partial [Halanaerobiales bacterium]|nr:ABC transporter substrate-binding protein [Halanaerobiales bacterium]
MAKKLSVMTMAVLMLVTLAAGCSQNSGEMSESNEDIQEITLCESWAFEQFFPVLTPENSTNYGLSFYLANFYETLVNYEAGQIVPGLAESWSVSEDGLVYTFNLREGVKFSDGTDFNAAVVKKNLEMIPKLLGRFSGEFAEVTTLFKEIRVIDPSTVEIHLSSPYYAALQDFTKLNPLAMISPKAFNEDGTLSEELLTATLGTGPYRYEGQHVDHVYTFTKNPYYWGEEPEIDLFHIKVIPDNQAKALALRSGEIDLIFGVSRISYDGFQEFSQDKKYGALMSTENIKTRFICFNLARAPFNEPEVRLAISQALDKQELCDNLFYGIETGADTFFSRSLPYCDVALEPYQYNVDQAKEILEAAGWQDLDGDGIREKDGQQL